MQVTFEDTLLGYHYDPSNRLFNMSALAWPIRTINQDQSKAHYCRIPLPFWCGSNPSSKSSSNSSRLPERLPVDIITIKIQFLSLNLHHSRVNNYFHMTFY